ncbi:hybrid sensor histidine kinase/response regulator [Desulfoluna spongiiphila]|uniref:hybrid sensor histidine kinase/response regulator n=1 Tax=Desulfoluna spongiiphila TaxID=419481 RepID=UPI001250E9E7|nr:response regulator [Desulfoluna spongiiphila]VVS91001.1 pac motif [Desulfoluna spongiiphila]
MDQFDVRLIPPLLSVYFGVCLSLFSLFRSRLKKETVLFTLLCLLASVRPVQFLLQRVVSDTGLLLSMERGILIAYAFIPYVGVLFFHRVLRVRRPRLEYGVCGVGLVMAAGALGPWFVSGLQTYPWGVIGKAGPLFFLYVVFGTVSFAYTIFCTVSVMRGQRDAEARLKQRYLFAALIGGPALLLVTVLTFIGSPMYPASNFMFVPMAVMAYGVLRHRTQDIGSVMRFLFYRLAYALVFLLPNFLVFLLLKPLLYGGEILSLAPLLLLWYAANYLSVTKLHPKVSRRFNRYRHHLKTVESKFARDLLILRDTRSLVAEFGELVRSTLRFRSIRFFFAPVEEPGRLMDMDGEEISLDESTAAFLVAEDCLIDHYFLNSELLMPDEEVRDDLKSIFDAYKGMCTVPLVQYDQLIGLVVFADKQGDAPVTPVEVEFLEKVSRYLSIALYNSRVYQAVTSVKDQLELRRRELSREILERRRAEESLRRSEGHYRLLSDNILDTLVVVEVAHETIQYASPSCLKMSGYFPAELVGSRFRDYLTKNSGRELARAVPPPEEGAAFLVELEHRRKDGELAWVEVSGHFIAAGDGRMEVVGLARDISERRVAEMEKEELSQKLRQAQKMESIGVLAGGIAHDFNNILMAILGYAQLGAMYLGEADGKAGEIVAQIETAGIRAKELVSQILAFSRQDEQARRAVDLVGITRESLSLMRPVIPRAISIDADFPARPMMVVADPVQIHQIVVNLFTNASHALEESAGGAIRVSVRQTTLDSGEARRYGLEPGPFVLLRVSDPGGGMDDEVRARIFEPYFTTKEPDKGTGMGLAVVQGIILSHNGAVVVASDKGAGTTVDVYLPEAAGGTDVPLSSGEPGKVCRGRVLFVDDETMLVELAGEALVRMGFEVVALEDPVEALDRFKKDPGGFDVVVTDMTMPRMSGLKLAESVRAVCDGVPVILCTGFSNEIVGRRHEEMGVSAVLFKPVPMKELAEAIHGVRSGQHKVAQELPAPESHGDISGRDMPVSAS